MSNSSLSKNVFFVVSCLLIIVFWYALTQLFSTKLDVSKNIFPESQYQQQRLLRFSYEVSNTGSQVISDAVFSSYLPVGVTSNQQVVEVKSSLNYQKEIGVLGNHVGHFDLGVIPPYGKKVVNFVAKIKTTQKPNRMLVEDAKKYLIEEPYVEISHPDIIQLSEKLQGQSDVESIGRIYDWVSSRVKYAGYISQDRGALSAIQNLSGDCTEYMYSVVALARALNIPARGIGGYVYATNHVVTPADYHNWAEVYLDGAWHIVDAQKKVLMKDSENYIAMRILSDASVSLLGSSHRFSTVNNNLTIKMK
jgi:transglutaminase-like putative cysteine protease